MALTMALLTAAMTPMEPHAGHVHAAHHHAAAPAAPMDLTPVASPLTSGSVVALVVAIAYLGYLLREMRSERSAVVRTELWMGFLATAAMSLMVVS